MLVTEVEETSGVVDSSPSFTRSMFLAGSAREGWEEAAQHLPGLRGRLQSNALSIHSGFMGLN